MAPVLCWTAVGRDELARVHRAVDRRTVALMFSLIAVAVLAVSALLALDQRQRRREWQDLTRPGMPARRVQPRRGVGHLGEAPVTIHHRLGGRRSDD